MTHSECNFGPVTVRGIKRRKDLNSKNCFILASAIIPVMISLDKMLMCFTFCSFLVKGEVCLWVTTTTPCMCLFYVSFTSLRLGNRRRCTSRCHVAAPFFCGLISSPNILLFKFPFFILMSEGLVHRAIFTFQYGKLHLHKFIKSEMSSVTILSYLNKM